jgi:hypothetical protein
MEKVAVMCLDHQQLEQRVLQCWDHRLIDGVDEVYHLGDYCIWLMMGNLYRMQDRFQM